MLVNRPISLYSTNAISPASSPMPDARKDINTMRNCAGSASLTSPTCSPVAAIVAGGGSPLLLLSGILSSFSCFLSASHNAIALHGVLQGSDQRRPSHAQLGLVMKRQSAQDLLALRSQRKQHLTPILAPAMPLHIAARSQPVHQLHRTVMLNLQPLRQFANLGTYFRGQAF